MNKKVRSELIEWAKSISVSIVLAMVITIVVQPTTVSGESMYPTLKDNDYLFINKLTYEVEGPKRGDIIVFKTELIDDKSSKKKSLVKRVIALPGEHIVIKNNEVYIDDELLNESYIKGVYTSGDIDIIVPENNIFIMGDNRENSLDSRDDRIGTISLDDVVGKVSMRVYPFDKIGSVN